MTTMATTMFFHILLLTPAIGICWAKKNPIGSEYVKNTSMNNEELRIDKSLVDRITDIALKKLKKSIVEPIALPNETVTLNKTILSIPLNGELALYKGELRGAREIERSGKVHSKYHDFYKIRVNSGFYFENLTFQYDFEANIDHEISTNGKVDGNIQQLIADAILDVDLRHKNIELTDLSLRSAKSINVRLENESYLDKFINVIIKVLTSKFKTAILTQLQKELQSLLGQKFDW